MQPENYAAAVRPAVSVIITSYNLEQYLPRTLESVCTQSLTDLEIIAVDDGSSDRSVQVLEELAGRDPRIRVLQRSHGGPVAARNAGIEEARGEYLAFVDGDDMLEQDFLATLHAAGRREQADICKGETLIVNPDGTSQATATNRSIRAMGSKLYFFGYWWSALYRRSLFEDHHLRFDRDNIYNEDLLFQNEALMLCRHLALADSVRYLYLRRGGDTFGAASSPEKIRCGAGVFMQIQANLRAHQDSLDRRGILYVQQACLKNLFNLARAAKLRGFGGEVVQHCLQLANAFIAGSLYRDEFVTTHVPAIFDRQGPQAGQD